MYTPKLRSGFAVKPLKLPLLDGVQFLSNEEMTKPTRDLGTTTRTQNDSVLSAIEGGTLPLGKELGTNRTNKDSIFSVKNLYTANKTANSKQTSMLTPQ